MSDKWWDTTPAPGPAAHRDDRERDPVQGEGASTPRRRMAVAVGWTVVAVAVGVALLLSITPSGVIWTSGGKWRPSGSGDEVVYVGEATVTFDRFEPCGPGFTFVPTGREVALGMATLAFTAPRTDGTFTEPAPYGFSLLIESRTGLLFTAASGDVRLTPTGRSLLVTSWTLTPREDGFDALLVDDARELGTIINFVQDPPGFGATCSPSIDGIHRLAEGATMTVNVDGSSLVGSIQGVSYNGLRAVRVEISAAR